MRSSCAICGDLLIPEAKRAFAKKDQNFIMLMSISLAGKTKIEDERSLAEVLTRQRSRICHLHLVEAGQYIVSEMWLAGKRVSLTEEVEGSKRKAYVSNGDIPQRLVSALDRKAEGLVRITPRDISHFLNHVLKRYYSTAMWPITEEMETGEDVVHNEVPGPSSSIKSYGPSSATKISACPPELREELSCGDVSTRSPTFHLEAFLGETDPAVLGRYFLVEGLLLMELFHFCPQCGHKLSETQLTAVGTAAIVKYICEMCYMNRQTAQQWESQERVVAHSKEDIPINMKQETPIRNAAAAVAVI